MNLIDSSNRSLLCGKCGAQFCQICESWFRDERKRGERPLCENCFTAEQESLRRPIEEERIKNEKEEYERLKKQREEEKIRKEKGGQDRLRKQRGEERCKLSNSFGMEFVKIPAGDFIMGSPESEKGRFENEDLLRKVTIRTPFLLGKYPVTQKQWEAVMRSNPSTFKGDDNPVEKVSWEDAQDFIKKLNQMEGTKKYRLPSEAEWEYACRAGKTTRYYFGDNESKLGDYVWYYDNSGNKTHPVGQKKPNPWDLYDMHGNVWEWCQDKYHDNYLGAPFDGSSWDGGGGSYRVLRGGSWSSSVRDCRSALRRGRGPGSRYDYVGFRLLRKL
ncbi:TPA: SUMF1/EgtB/PvdO family nonheme iron enzyme [Methanosarcinaceae archaeon]|nr:SUMF1/EgtB/PvdO family nonheme iron enzyme [Methanosarcinaceae archaeon]